MIIDGKAIAAQVKASLQGSDAKLAVIMVGDDPASSVYVRNKERACAEVGIRSCRAYGRERRRGRRLPEQERLFLQARFSTYEGRPREIPRGLRYQHECADKKNNFGELLVLLLRSLQRGELCKANQGLRPRRTTPAGLRSSRGSRARALCY